MAGISLAQSARMTNDVLQAGVIEVLATESKLLQLLPFMNVQGSGYTYNIEKNLGSAQFRKVNGGYTIAEIETIPVTERIVILGDEAVVDTYQIAVESDINNLMAIEVALRTKAIAHKFEKCFINGGSKSATAGVPSETVANEFVGILPRYTEATPANIPTEALTLFQAQVIEKSEDLIADLDTLLDMVVGGADCLIMNKKTRRQLTAKGRAFCEYRQGEFGTQFVQYGGVDIVDIDGELLADDIIIAAKFGAKEAVCGLQNGGVRVTALGEMESQPQLKTRIEWFVGLAVFNPKTVAVRKVAASTGK